MKPSAKRIAQRYAEELATRQVGTCGFCNREVRVQQDKLVLHGYKRPGTGFAEGRCPGAGLPPYELSPKTAEIGLDYYKDATENTKKRLAHYIANPLSIIVDVDSIDLASRKVVRKPMSIVEWGEREYPALNEELREPYIQRKIKYEIDNVERALSTFKAMLTEYKEKVDNWKLVPLVTFDEKRNQQQEKKDEREKRLVENRVTKYVALKEKLLDRINSSFAKLKTEEAKFRRIEDPSGTLTSKNINLAKALMDRHRNLVELLTESPNKLNEALGYALSKQELYKDLGVDEIYRHLGLLKGGQYLSKKESGIDTSYGSFKSVGSEWKPNWPGY